MPDETVRKTPVTILTGFLGSGKTTLLNYLVKQPALKSTAVIINEFGEIGIDHLLVETSSEQIVEMNNGCICCTIRGDLQDKLSSLAMWLATGRIPAVERVVIETTGLADPAPIIHTLMTDEQSLNRYRLSGVVTVVDAITGSSSIDHFPEAVRQIAIADQVIVSKKDLVGSLSDEDRYRRFRQRVRRINPNAAVVESDNGVVDPDIVLRQETNNVVREITRWGRLVSEGASDEECGHEENVHSHQTDSSGINTVSIKLDEPLDRGRFNDFIQALTAEFGERLLRTKGVLNVADEEKPAVVQGVQHVFFPIAWLDEWPDADRSSKLVFITHGVAPDLILARLEKALGSNGTANQPS